MPREKSSMTALVIDTVPAARLARYRRLVSDDRLALDEFYRWAQRLALTMFADVAVLEVAMRSAMARELHAIYGPLWYRNQDLFDDDSMENIGAAIDMTGLDTLAAAGADENVLEGKLVAGLMFGFWVRILGRGGSAGDAPQRQRRIYDELLWKPALTNAFPAAPDRRKTAHAAHRVQEVRNRVAHHEHVIWGIPLPDERKRLSVTEAHDSLLKLAGYLGQPVRECIEATSEVHAQLDLCPVDRSQLLL